MTQDQILVLAVLGAAMALFVQGRWRHDVVAFGALLAATVLGLVPSSGAFDGFGHPAVFTVAAILVVSRALQTSGALDGVAGRVARLRDRPVLQAAALTALATALSAFMNNVGALALVMPIALSTARQSGRPVSLLLMPIAFGACLGGLTTLIGTPPNLILSQYREGLVGEPFGMFTFTPIGLPLALVGLGFLATCAPRLLPTDRAGDDPAARGFDVGRYVTELVVVHDAPVIGRTLRDLLGADAAELDVLGIVRSEVPVRDSVEDLPLRPGDVLRIRAESEVFTQLAQRSGLRIGSHVDRLADDG
ncbi:MAG: SLC13 family permease, partial [Planctomycetota bacterium]